MKDQIPYVEAKKIADEIVAMLAPDCVKIDIAGSIRREKSIIGDIEICCIPKPFDTDLFASGIAVTVNQWKKVKGELPCKYTQRILPQGIKLDLFMPDDFDYYRQLAIRTGSADYSSKIIATGWKKLGWCGSDVGLRKISDCTETKNGQGKSVYKCTNPDAELPPIWQSEQEFFQWLRVEYLEPKNRNI